MTKTPKLSVCIPAYNSVTTIRATVDSVLAQTFGDFEIVICDDTSIDGTYEIISAFKEPRIKVFKNEKNLGLGGNWHKAVRLSTGDYVKLLPADDLLWPYCLEREVKVLDADPSLGFVVSDTQLIDENGGTAGSFTRAPFKTGKCAGKAAAMWSIRFGNSFGSPANVTFKRSLYNQIGGFDSALKYCNDFDLWLGLASRSDFYYIRRTLSSFRIRKSSNTGVVMRRQQHAWLLDHVKMVKKHQRIGLLKIKGGDILIHKTVRRLRTFVVGFFVAAVSRRRSS